MKFFAVLLVGIIGFVAAQQSNLPEKVGNRIKDVNAKLDKFWDERAEKFQNILGKIKNEVPSAPTDDVNEVRSKVHNRLRELRHKLGNRALGTLGQDQFYDAEESQEWAN